MAVVEVARQEVVHRQRAWSAFWEDPVQLRCLSGATDIGRIFTARWSKFAQTLPFGAQVLDLGCGAGAVGHALLGARPDLHVQGVDIAEIPYAGHGALILMSNVAMEALPFAAGRFRAVVSQFGFEYSRREDSAPELARVLAPSATFALLVHHADSAIVAENRARAIALDELMDRGTQDAFHSGDVLSLRATLRRLAQSQARDVVAALANALSALLRRDRRERAETWRRIETALAPERCILGALQAACVAPDELHDWLTPLRQLCILRTPTALHEPGGAPIAWWIEGARRAP